MLYFESVAVLAEKWRCYVCDSTPLKSLASYCDSVLVFAESLQDKGNVAAASVKKKQNAKAKEELSDSSDTNPGLFSGSNVAELVKLLKSTYEPLQQLVAETEELLADDSSAGDGISHQQKYETVAAKLKTQYMESLRSLSDVQRTQLPADMRNCTVDIERLGQMPAEQTNLSKRKHVAGSSVVDTDDDSSSRTDDCANSSSRASRADIEAQRDLHKQMLTSKDESSESDSDSSDSSSSSSTNAESENSDDDDDDDDDEYDPKKEIQLVKMERGHERRTTAKKQKVRAGN